MRQFLALDLPDRWRRDLDDTRRRLLGDDPGWRLPAIDSVHLTLRFLGEVEDSIDTGARAVWAGAVGSLPAFDLRLTGFGTFPERGRPRIFWAGVEGGASLQGLASALETAARSLGLAAEDRRFRPHLTLARARRGHRVRAPRVESPCATASFAVEEVILFRSVLDPAGARYTALDRFALNVAGD